MNRRALALEGIARPLTRQSIATLGLFAVLPPSQWCTVVVHPVPLFTAYAHPLPSHAVIARIAARYLADACLPDILVQYHPSIVQAQTPTPLFTVQRTYAPSLTAAPNPELLEVGSIDSIWTAQLGLKKMEVLASAPSYAASPYPSVQYYVQAHPADAYQVRFIMSNWKISAGDTTPLEANLFRGGKALDLTGATVVWKMRRQNSTDAVITGTCSIPDASKNTVVYGPKVEETSVAGIYSGYFHVTWEGGPQAKCPTEGVIVLEISSVDL